MAKCNQLTPPPFKGLMTFCTEWREEYISSLPPPADKLKAEVEQYMSEYDRRVEEVGRLYGT